MEKEKIFHILQVNMLIFSVFVQVSPSCLNCCGISFRREELHLYLRVQVVTSRGGQCRLCGDKLQGYSPNNVLCWLSCFVSAWAQQIGRLRLPIEILKCKWYEQVETLLLWVGHRKLEGAEQPTFEAFADFHIAPAKDTPSLHLALMAVSHAE
jgi:hypothetical protein